MVSLPSSSLLIEEWKKPWHPPSGASSVSEPNSQSLMLTTRLRFIEPQLASSVDQPPEGKHWVHEIKHNGYRCQVLLERGHARVFTRNGYDWSDRYPSIVRAAADLRCQSAIIDGEAIVQDGNGASHFEALSSAIRGQPSSMRSICSTSMARTSVSKRSWSDEPA
jgi:ATP-dependent DNA ligase